MTQGTWKGWKAVIYLKDDGAYERLGYSESVTIDVATGLEPFYQHGQRYPKILASGNEEITGSISRAWVDMQSLAYGLSGGLTGQGSGAEIDTFDMYLYVDPNDTGAPFMYVYGCRAESGAVDIPQDGFVMADIDFRALYITYGEEV